MNYTDAQPRKLLAYILKLWISAYATVMWVRYVFLISLCGILECWGGPRCLGLRKKLQMSYLPHNKFASELDHLTTYVTIHFVLAEEQTIFRKSGRCAGLFVTCVGTSLSRFNLIEELATFV